MKRVFRFSAFELDTAAGTLRRDGESLPITPKVYGLLLALLERRGELVAKEELMARLWPDTVVEEANLSVTMSALRKVLGEQPPEAKFIETVPRRGYRFVAALAPEESGAAVEQPAEAAPAPEPPPAPRRLRPRWLVPAAAGAVLAMAAVGTWYSRRPAPGYRTLAVLPFRTTSQDPATASLGLGMADSLIYRLAAAQTIMVRPTTSVLRFAAAPDPVAAGRALAADIVLTGFVQVDGRNLRVTTQLLRVADGASVWSGKFENSFTNIFMVQDSIADKVAASLAMQLSDPARARMNRRPTESTEAYREYVLGRFLLSGPRPDEIDRAIPHLKRAISLDPAYALAYATLSEAYMDTLRTQPTSEVRELARQHALKAVDLDPQLARGHAAVGGVQALGDWNWAGARASCHKARSLDPRDAVVRQFCGATLLALGEFDAAIEEFRVAAEVDPEWRDPPAFQTVAELAAGRVAQAEALALSLLSRFPGDQFITRNLAKVRWRQNRLSEAISLQQQAVRLFPGLIPRAELAQLLAAAGHTGEARGIVASLNENPGGEPAAFARVIAHAGLGNKEIAFRELDRAIEIRTMALVWIRFNPMLDSLRGDPRFAAAIRRVGC